MPSRITRPLPLDIAVCGCGPAGLAAALLLHRAGHRVQIFERFSQPKPVGSGLLLQPTGLAVLREMQLLDRILELATPIARLLGRAVPSNRIALDVRYDALGSGWSAFGIHRAALFDVLSDAARQADIGLTPNATVRRIQHLGERVAVIADNDQGLGEFDLVVDALGANSPLATHGAKRTLLEYGALWVNVPWSTRGELNYRQLEQRYRRASQMVGVLPIGKQSTGSPLQAAFFWSLKRSEVDRWRDRGIDRWRSDVEQLWPQAAELLGQVDTLDRVTFAHYEHFTARTPYSQRLVHIGDSAHATSPQLGQGANMALLDALALALALEKHATLADSLADYARMRRRHIRLFQGASAIFTPFYQSDSRWLPWLRDWITAPLSRLPIGDVVVARLVSGMTTSPLRGAKFAPQRIE